MIWYFNSLKLPIEFLFPYESDLLKLKENTNQVSKSFREISVQTDLNTENIAEILATFEELCK